MEGSQASRDNIVLKNAAIVGGCKQISKQSDGRIVVSLQSSFLNLSWTRIDCRFDCGGMNRSRYVPIASELALHVAGETWFVVPIETTNMRAPSSHCSFYRE